MSLESEIFEMQEWKEIVIERRKQRLKISFTIAWVTGIISYWPLSCFKLNSRRNLVFVLVWDSMIKKPYQNCLPKDGLSCWSALDLHSPNCFQFLFFLEHNVNSQYSRQGLRKRYDMEIDLKWKVRNQSRISFYSRQLLCFNFIQSGCLRSGIRVSRNGYVQQYWQIAESRRVILAGMYASTIKRIKEMALLRVSS